jgi:hypothetical protein
MSAHTPGPWEARDSCVIGPNGRVVVACVEGFVSRGDNDEDYATARLIAAAPELLEALLEVIDETAFYQARFSTEEWCSKARAALAKAVQP